MGEVQTGLRPWTIPWAAQLAVGSLAVAACFWVSSRARLASPLWMDDLITVSMAESTSLTHVFDAIWRGLDNTPPLYAVLGWVLHGLLPAGTNVAVALRVANAVFLASTLWLIYGIAREFLPRHLAAACVCIFLASEQQYFAYLFVEVRTYALFIACATLSLRVAIRDVAEISAGPSVSTGACLLMLTASHTFGIVYACTLTSAAMVVFAAGKQWSKIKDEALCLAPSIMAVVAWIPVFRHEAAIPSWMASPGFLDLIAAFHPPHSRLAFLALVAGTALSLCVLSISSRRSGRVLLPIDPRVTLLVVLPLMTALTMAAIWCESRVGFHVFHQRYFGYNILLVFAAVLVCMTAARRLLPAVSTRASTILVVACIALCADLLLRPFPADDNIPCLDPATRAFAEDGVGQHLPVLAPFSVSWLPRVRRPGWQVLFPADSHLVEDDNSHPEYANSQAYVQQYAVWAGIDSVTTDARLATLSNGFLVVENGLAPWFANAVRGSDFTFSLLSRSPTCRVWKALPVPTP